MATADGAPTGERGRPSPAHRPTLEVVAARAGVSRATASRVLRGESNVSPQARAAVLQAADAIAYRVNRAARSLVTRRSDSVAFLVAETEDRMFHDPYFLGILRGAQAETAAAGLQLVFVVASTAEETTSFEHFAGGGHVDGVLLVSLHGDTKLPQHLEAMGVPTVLNGRPYDDADELYSVDADNEAGARLAAEHLLAAGCRRIATVTGPLDMSAGQDRLTGFTSALAEAGRPLDPALCVEADFTEEGGAAAMQALLRAAPDIDAVFAASDLMAIGAMQALAEHGRKVPDDVAVIGFDDTRQARSAVPPLTTVRQPINDLGRTMARVLLGRIAHADVAQRTVLPTELVTRGSA
jgi:DNA-binding LacI/PurR family transcriptional regulator